MTEKQSKLLEFVKKMHGEQKRKYTGEPYWHHCVCVATIVSEFENDCFEVGLCHDLYEDTECDFNMLYKELCDIGYNPKFAYKVCTWVSELTDKYDKSDYPYFNRSKRKKLEAKRLHGISYQAQSVKYADLIDNTSSIVQFDKSFAEVYLKEKKEILEGMVFGNPVLLLKCNETLLKAEQDLTPSIK